MSLNELVSTDHKLWLNVRANNVTIGGNLTNSTGLQNYVLGYGADLNVTFSPQLKIKNLSVDTFGIIPQQNVSDGLLTFEAGPLPSDNFTIFSPTELKCLNAGTYLVILKFVEALNTVSVNARPNPFLSINGIPQSGLSLRTPLCSTSFPSYSGGQISNVFAIPASASLNLNLAVQPSGTINMMNESFASNLIIIKIA